MRHTRNTATSLLILIATCFAPAHAIAQDPEGDEDIAPERGDDGVLRFKNVAIKEITPTGLDKLQLEEPTSMIRDARSLPEPPSAEQLSELTRTMAANVVRVAALHMPPQPYEQIPMIYYGHAVWLSAKEDGSDPVLVSTSDWLDGAQEIYVIPPDEDTLSADTDYTKRDATTISLRAATSGKKQLREFKRAARDYTAAKLHAVDSFRGLAHLKVESPRDTGLALFDTKKEALPYLYGYSPYAPELLVPTTILPREDKEEYLAYFFQTSYQGISGAPIVARDGRVVMLSALRHPKNPKRGLAIPPGSLRQFVQASQK